LRAVVDERRQTCRQAHKDSGALISGAVLHAPLHWNTASLCCLVDYGGDLENRIERVVACHDTPRWSNLR
jgi:hypothetical protein